MVILETDIERLFLEYVGVILMDHKVVGKDIVVDTIQEPRPRAGDLVVTVSDETFFAPACYESRVSHPEDEHDS